MYSNPGKDHCIDASLWRASGLFKEVVFASRFDVYLGDIFKFILDIILVEKYSGLAIDTGTLLAKKYRVLLSV